MQREEEDRCSLPRAAGKRRDATTGKKRTSLSLPVCCSSRVDSICDKSLQ